MLWGSCSGWWTASRSRGRWRELQLLYGFMVFYTALHLMTWSMIRYRLPVDAVLLIFAALALAKIAARSPVRKDDAAGERGVRNEPASFGRHT